MSRFFPHTPYAEDQPLARTILWTHVLTRGFTMGSIIGAGVGTGIVGLQKTGFLKSPAIATIPFTRTVLRSSGTGAVIGTALISLALPLRMRGRAEIEWQDRSYRLMENKGQLECDDFTYSAMAASALAVGIKGQGLGWRGAVGGVGLGSVAGMAGYMGWRYGVKGGKFDESVV